MLLIYCGVVRTLSLHKAIGRYEKCCQWWNREKLVFIHLRTLPSKWRSTPKLFWPARQSGKATVSWGVLTPHVTEQDKARNRQLLYAECTKKIILLPSFPRRHFVEAAAAGKGKGRGTCRNAPLPEIVKVTEIKFFTHYCFTWILYDLTLLY